MTRSIPTKRQRKKQERRNMNKMMKKTKKKDMSISKLGEDLIRSILIRLPPKKLIKASIVCKQWFNMTSEPYFIQQHSRFSSDYGIVISLRTSKHCQVGNYIIMIKDGVVKRRLLRNDLNRGRAIKACCNGLLLIGSGEYVYVYNPTTNQTMELPQPSFRKTRTYGFVFVSATHEYKIVRLIQGNKHDTLGWCVLVFKGAASENHQTLQWRYINGPKKTFGIPSHIYKPISVNGFLYWIDYGQRIALALDVGAEKFYTVALPESSVSKAGFIEMGGFLSFVKYREPQDLEIWILEDVYTGRWVLRRSITVHSRIIESPPRCSFDNGEVIIFRRRAVLWAYNVRLESWTELGCGSKLVFCAPYVSSIASLKTIVKEDQEVIVC